MAPKAHKSDDGKPTQKTKPADNKKLVTRSAQVAKTAPASPADEVESPKITVTAAPPRPVRAPIHPSKAHVLVVEDNVPNFVLVARMLAFMGVQRCEWKTSGWQVVEFADTLPRIDLILMDIRLPYKDGFQALDEIRKHERFKDTLIVAVTAEASTEQMERAREAGFDAFLGKPLDPDRFPDQIKRVLSGSEVWELH
jgi:two-component system cell cycle response regulator DivK